VIGTLVRAAWFAAVYLLVLTSLAPGDVLLAALLGVAAAIALRSPGSGGPREPLLVRLGAAARLLAQTGLEMVRGTWVTARFCLGAAASPALVEIPRGERSPASVATWGVLTGEAPDEYPVDVDTERGVLLVHVIHGADPDAVRERHRSTYERWQRRVVP
jgi:multicomponent Na+:H+ antiporter subunit E